MNNRTAIRTWWMALALLAPLLGPPGSAAADWVTGAAVSHCRPKQTYSDADFYINHLGANNISSSTKEVLCGFGVPGDVATELYIDYRDKHNSQAVECWVEVMGWDSYTLYWSGYQSSAPTGHQTGYFHFNIPASARGYANVRCKIPATEGGWRSSVAGINYGF